MSKSNALNMAATLVAAIGLVKLVGSIESVSDSALTIFYKKKRSSKYKRKTIPMSDVVAYGKDKKTDEQFVTYRGRVEYEEFVGSVSNEKNGFIVLDTETGKVNVRAGENVEIESVEDFDAPGGKKKKKDKGDGEGKKKKKKKK